MKRVTVKIGDNMCILKADRMTVHGESLYVYNGDELVGMFAESDVRAAYVTEQREA